MKKRSEKKIAILITAIVLLILMTIFTWQNAPLVNVSLFFWDFRASLSLILFMSFVAGLVISVTTLLPIIISLKATKTNLANEVIELKKQNASKV